MSTYLNEYKSKLISPKAAAALVKDNYMLNYSFFCARPYDFDIALADRVGELKNIFIKTSGGLPPAAAVITKDTEQKSFQVSSGYWTALDRYFGDRMLLDQVPINYHDANRLAEPDRRARELDIFIGQATPMDKHGYFNFGISNTECLAAALIAKTVIIEVNQSFPVCLGGYQESIHISNVDYIIEGSNNPPYEVPEEEEASPAERRIAELIIEEIHDGCCLQLGIGSLPNTIGELIAHSDLKDLGIQTEMFCPTMVDMHEAGKITNSKKNVDRYKTTYSFALGDKRTYDFLDSNPGMASCYVEYLNDPARIIANDNVISINNLLEIDLLTQVCSESKGLRLISGCGGQLDWVHGATDSNGGKSFLAFTSTTTDKDGNLVSRVRPMLTPGAVVTVPRHSVHWVVTEYGKVRLKGLSIWERAEEIIKIAHPDFRDELLAEAEKMGIWKKINRKPIGS